VQSLSTPLLGREALAIALGVLAFAWPNISALALVGVA
jgi:hypothetical protein